MLILLGVSGYSLADWDLWISSTWGNPLEEMFHYQSGFEVYVRPFPIPRPWMSGGGRVVQPRTVPRVPVDVVPPTVDLEPPGNCSPGEHRRLQRTVDAECKFVGQRSCDVQNSCATLFAKLDQNVACYNARQTINHRCFEDRDEDHRKAARAALNAQQRCWNYLVRNRCPV